MGPHENTIAREELRQGSAWLRAEMEDRRQRQLLGLAVWSFSTKLASVTLVPIVRSAAPSPCNDRDGMRRHIIQQMIAAKDEAALAACARYVLRNRLLVVDLTA